MWGLLFVLLVAAPDPGPEPSAWGGPSDMAKSASDAVRCAGYAARQAQERGKDPLYDQRSVSWMLWFYQDLDPHASSADADRRLRASIKTAETALQTDKGRAEAAVCDAYYKDRKAREPDPQ